MSILVVTYSLLPQGIYPLPVEQSIQAMKHILEDIGKPPSRMLLAGDSAGATLPLTFLRMQCIRFPECLGMKAQGSNSILGVTTTRSLFITMLRSKLNQNLGTSAISRAFADRRLMPHCRQTD